MHQGCTSWDLSLCSLGHVASYVCGLYSLKPAEANYATIELKYLAFSGKSRNATTSCDIAVFSLSKLIINH